MHENEPSSGQRWKHERMDKDGTKGFFSKSLLLDKDGNVSWAQDAVEAHFQKSSLLDKTISNKNNVEGRIHHAISPNL